MVRILDKSIEMFYQKIPAQYRSMTLKDMLFISYYKLTLGNTLLPLQVKKIIAEYSNPLVLYNVLEKIPEKYSNISLSSIYPL